MPLASNPAVERYPGQILLQPMKLHRSRLIGLLDTFNPAVPDGTFHMTSAAWRGRATASRLAGGAGRAARTYTVGPPVRWGDGEPGRADDRVDGIGELQLRVMVLAHGVAPGLDDRRQDVVGEDQRREREIPIEHPGLFVQQSIDFRARAYSSARAP